MAGSRRALMATTLATTMVLGAAMPAAGASTTFRGEAIAAGVLLNLLDSASLEGATADAVAGSAGGGDASGAGVNILAMTTTAAASTTDATVRDPETGQNCVVPTLPAPLANLPLSPACSDSSATGGATPSAEAHATLVDVSLNGLLLADLVDLIVAGVADDLTAQIDLALEPLEDAAGPLVDPVVAGLTDACAAGLGPVAEVGQEAVDAANSALDGIPDNPLTEAAIGVLQVALEGASQVLPAACAELVRLLADLPSVNALVTDVTDALTEALRDLVLAELSIGGSTASVETLATTVVSEAEAALVQLELPALGDLTDLLTGLVTDVLDAAVGALSESLAEVFRDLVPTVTNLLDAVLVAIQLPDLLSASDPLLVLEILPASATSTFDRATGEIVTSGAGAVVTLTLSSAFATLLGEDSTTVAVPAGDTVTVLEGTPLESTFTFSDPTEVTRTTEGVVLLGTAVAALGADLLTGVNGGVSLTIASVEAVSGGSIVLDNVLEAPDPEPPLPRTGGGAALAAIALLGLGLVVRRRED